LRIAVSSAGGFSALIRTYVGSIGRQEFRQMPQL
jgi:hypothetical protein